ncbi:MAG: pyridoxal-dependent decarboxylase [Geminicoccaceae bacterium]
MDIDSFRAEAHRLVDRMADYLQTVEDRPVRARTRPGAVAAMLPASPPEAGESMRAILDDVERIVVPGLTHWQHPRFMAYFPSNSSPPSILAEMLTATFAAQCMLWQTSPAGTELETVALDWLRQLIGIPEGFAGVIQDTASSATLCAILTAREKATDWRSDKEGLVASPLLAVYASDQAHSSVEKAVRIAGLGRNALHLIPSDDAWRMRPDLLEQAILADRAAGRIPACIVASIGTTGVGAADPLRPIGEIARRHGVHLHVDAAWAGSALICPEHRWMIDGIEHADSLVMNPHKWLLTNFDCTAYFVRDPDSLVRTLTVMPAYLVGQETGRVIDYRDWGIQLGRRFRALKLWFVLRSYGAEALRSMIRDHVGWTAELAAWIGAAPDFELTSGPNLALLSFRYRPPGIPETDLDALNERLLTAINDDGRTYLTQNRLGGRYVIRVSIGARTTEHRHVAEVWEVIQELARNLRPA